MYVCAQEYTSKCELLQRVSNTIAMVTGQGTEWLKDTCTFQMLMDGGNEWDGCGVSLKTLL